MLLIFSFVLKICIDSYELWMQYKGSYFPLKFLRDVVNENKLLFLKSISVTRDQLSFYLNNLVNHKNHHHHLTDFHRV